MVSTDEIAMRLRAALSATDGIVSAYLFGSALVDRLHRESDIDVGVLLSRDRYPAAADRFDARLRLVSALTAAVGREADVVILNDAPPHLARHVMWDGRPLLVIDAEADHAARRLALSRAADLEPFLRRARAVLLRAIRA